MGLEKTKNITQTWFEMPEIRKRFFNRNVWIPLKETRVLSKEGEIGYVGFKEEYFGVGSIAVPVSQRSEAEKLGWDEIGIREPSTGYLEEGEYIPANVYKNYEGTFTGERLVLARRGNSIECPEWSLNQDLVVTLGLKIEGDVWLALSRGYEEVARLERDENGCPTSISIKAFYLKDYLCTRKMALYLISYRSRVQIVENKSHIQWKDNPSIHNEGMDRWEGRVTAIHEGGYPFGSGFSVLHISRTDVDYEEDVPQLDFPTDKDTKSERKEGNFRGRKLYRIEGELWRNEWVEPASKSHIVAGEETEPTAFFITDSSGKTENRKTLDQSTRWLWFNPSIMNALLSIRGSSLSWYTKDTGGIECSPGYSIHFGINRAGLINVLAKDIGSLPDWQQKIWAGHNVAPDGKVSAELLMSQMEARPASTQAPEQYISAGIEIINAYTLKKYGFSVFKQHVDVNKILARTHRFRALDEHGLFELAKDLYRLIGETIDATKIKEIVRPKKDEKWGELKSLGKLLASETDGATAEKLFTPLWGVYKLRNADAHLPSKEIEEAYKACRIDRQQPLVMQGYQLIHCSVSCLYRIIEIIHRKDRVGIIEKSING